tara:strand:+ start:1390 stop:1767 length:378 start_codon:yes stop_codon:yes gene_type:complete
MKIDDFMSQADSFDTNSDTITGYFGIDDEVFSKKVKKGIVSAMESDKKSDIVMTIDAITDTKLEGILLGFLLSEQLADMRIDVDSAAKTAPLVAMSLSLCKHKGLIEESNMEAIAEAFSEIFARL